MGSYKKYGGTTESVSSAMDIFATPPTNTSVLTGAWREINTTYPLSETGGLEFNIPTSLLHYLDLMRTFVAVEVAVQKSDGTALHATTMANINVWPGDSFAHSLFKSIEVSVNGVVVERVDDYPYRAFIEQLLNYEKGSKLSSLKAAGWYEDANLCRDAASNADATTARKGDVKGSRSNSYYFKPHLSILNQDRYLFPGNNLTIKLERTDPSFCLSAEGANPGDGAKIKLVSCKLYARQLTVNPSIQEAHNQTLLNFVPGKFFTDKVSTTLFTIPPGTVTVDRNIQFSGQLPKYAFVGFVKHAAASGQFDLNPFNFSNYNVKSLALSVDGVPVSEPYEPDFANGKYAREYVHFLMTGREALCSVIPLRPKNTTREELFTVST